MKTTLKNLKLEIVQEEKEALEEPESDQEEQQNSQQKEQKAASSKFNLFAEKLGLASILGKN